MRLSVCLPHHGTWPHRGLRCWPTEVSHNFKETRNVNTITLLRHWASRSHKLIVTLKSVLKSGWVISSYVREGVIKMVDVLTFRLLSRSLWKKNHVCILYTLLGKCGAFDVDMLFNLFFFFCKMRVYCIFAHYVPKLGGTYRKCPEPARFHIIRLCLQKLHVSWSKATVKSAKV